MPWDYDYRIDSEDPMNYCTAFDVVTEGMAGREGINFRIPGMHGELSHPFKLFDGHDVIINSVLRYTDGDDLITHVNGAAGHVYENKNALMRILGRVDQLVPITRLNPDTGTREVIEIEVLNPVDNTRGNEHQLIWPCRAPRPFWRNFTITNHGALSAGSLTPEGNADIDDGVFTFSGDGIVVNNSTGDRIQVAGSGGATVVVDCGARTVRQGSADRDEWFIPFSNRWIHLLGGRGNNLGVSGSVSLSYYGKRH